MFRDLSGESCLVSFSVPHARGAAGAMGMVGPGRRAAWNQGRSFLLFLCHYQLRAQVNRGLSGRGTDHAVQLLQERCGGQMLTPRDAPRDVSYSVSASLS